MARLDLSGHIVEATEGGKFPQQECRNSITNCVIRLHPQSENAFFMILRQQLARLFLLFSIAALPCSASEPINLVLNPHFDHDLSSWQTRTGDQPVWMNFDFAGSAGSGSAYTVNTNPTAFNAEIELVQCIPLPSAGDYFFKTSGYAATGQTAGVLYVTLILHPGPQTDCSNGAVFVGSQLMSPADEWRSVQRTLSVQALPATAEIWLRPENDVANGNFGGYFDNILLSNDAIFIGDFEPRG